MNGELEFDNCLGNHVGAEGFVLNSHAHTFGFLELFTLKLIGRISICQSDSEP